MNVKPPSVMDLRSVTGRYTLPADISKIKDMLISMQAHLWQVVQRARSVMERTKRMTIETTASTGRSAASQAAKSM